MRKYTNSQFIEAVNNSTSIRQVLQKLNLKPCGGNYQSFRNLVKKLALDISHFLGQGHNKGKIIGPKRPIEDYFDNQFVIQSHKLKLRLIREGYFIHECCKCKLQKWLDVPIPLELNHIDGNHCNNNLTNLELLCPNCHALTDNYRGKNRGKAYLKS